MKIVDSDLADVKVIEPRVFGDERGFFFESFNRQRFFEQTGLDLDFVQDNHSRSARGVLRGMHYQIDQVQGKLVRVVRGQVFDVAIDLRKSSAQFGCWTGQYLSADNFRQMWVPPGFAHGFLVLEDNTEVLYKTTDYYAPQHERAILWNDSDLAIDWPFEGLELQLSEKDRNGSSFADAEYFS